MSYLFYLDLLDVGFTHFYVSPLGSLLSIHMDLTHNKEDTPKIKALTKFIIIAAERAANIGRA